MRIASFILVLLCIPLVSAEVLFDDWVVSGEQFSAIGQNFTAYYISGREVGRVENTQRHYLFARGECKEDEDYRFCFSELDDSERVQYRNGEAYPALKIRVESLEPELSISRTLSANTVDLGGRIELTATIENKGEKPALNVRYVDRLPEGIVAVSGGGAQRYPGRVEWTGVLSAKKSIAIKYTLEARSFIEAESIATVSYYHEDQLQTIESDPLKISVTLPFEITQKFTPEELELNTETSYKVTIDNTYNRPLTIDAFTLIIPPGMSVIRASQNWKADAQKHTYTFSGEISDSETFELKFRVPQKGSYDLDSTLTVTAEGKTFTKELRQPVRIGISQLIPHIELNPETVKAKSPYRINAWVENAAGDNIKLQHAELKGSAMSEGGVNVDNRNIRFHDEEEIYSKRLISPSVSSSKSYVFTLSGSYLDKRNQSLMFSDSATLTVEPLPEVVRFEVFPKYLSMPRSTELPVKVFITNVGREALKGVKVADLLPKGINLLEGKPSADIDLTPGERKIAYQYTIQVLDAYRDAKVLTLKTSANAELSDGSLYTTDAQTHVLFGELKTNAEFDTSSSVVPATEPSTENGSTVPPSEPRDIPLPKVVPEKSPGIFTRFIAWIKGLF